MTTLDIIKAMPIDDKLKMQIVNNYDDMKPGQKSAIDHTAWTTFHAVYHELVKENLALQFEKVKQGEDHFGGDFDARAVKKAESDMQNDLQESLGKADLAIARTAMEKIVREMSAARHPLPKLEDLDKN